jgi:hypothetical protein
VEHEGQVVIGGVENLADYVPLSPVREMEPGKEVETAPNFLSNPRSNA